MVMKVGDLVRLKSYPNMYGVVVEIRPNLWVGNQVTVEWVEKVFGSHRKYYAQQELEVINEKQV
jgi:hypothetical protein